MTISQRNMLIIFFVGTGLLLLGNGSIPMTDPVESNYTLTAAEMLASGDYISPRIYGNYWFDKPVFFYWELIAAFSAFGINDFAARFFPVVFGVLGLFLTYFFAKRIYDEKTGFWSAMILGTCFEYWIFSKTVITDSTLFFFFDGVLVFFYLAYTGQNKNLYYLCYVFSGLAVLTKGPIGILLPGLIVTIFILIRRDLAEVKNMKPLGFILFVVIAGSWYYLMYRLHGQQFIDMFLGVHNYLRATVSEHPMWDVWWYYTVIFFLGFMPWSFITLPPILCRIIRERRFPELDANKLFLLVWALTINIFYQNMATKYTTYTMPGLMPIAILAARYFYEREGFLKKLVTVNVIVLVGLTFFVTIPIVNRGDFSRKQVGEYLRENTNAGDMICSLGEYKTSTVYYSGRKIYRLLHEYELEKVRPKAMSWNMKNVMPLYEIEKLPSDRTIYLIVHNKKDKIFAEEFSNGVWREMATFSDCKLYRREAVK